MNHRLKRVCEILKRELGGIILREFDFSPVLVVVNAVDITPDLKHAHVYISALGGSGQQSRVLTTLEKARVHLQRELSKRVTLKYTPLLHFKIDTAIERGSRVLDIMEQLGLEENV